MNTKGADRPADPAAAPIAGATTPPPTAANSRAVARAVERWWTEFFPENGGTVPYLSGAWHHCRDAKDELIRRLAAL